MNTNTIIDFETKISCLVSSSRTFSSKKHAIDAVVSLAFFLLKSSSSDSNAIHRKFEQLRCNNEKLLIRLEEEDFEKVKLCAIELLSIYAKSEPFSDVLAYIYSSCLSYKRGQHMTPPDVADFIFELQYGASNEQFEGLLDRAVPLSIGDVTGCGLGSLLLAQIRGVYRHYGKAGVKCLDLTGIDIDKTMCLATVFQIEVGSILFDIPYNQLQIFNCNVITEYNNEGTDVYFCIPDVRSFKRYIPEKELEKETV